MKSSHLNSKTLPRIKLAHVYILPIFTCYQIVVPNWIHVVTAHQLPWLQKLFGHVTVTYATSSLAQWNLGEDLKCVWNCAPPTPHTHFLPIIPKPVYNSLLASKSYYKSQLHRLCLSTHSTTSCCSINTQFMEYFNYHVNHCLLTVSQTYTNWFTTKNRSYRDAV